MIGLFLLFLFFFSIFGILLGTIAGLFPGFHPNNVAFILLSITPLITPKMHFLTAFFPSENVFILIAATIIAASISNTFLNFIPTAFIGAPDDDTALSLLPAHLLLLEGRAYETTVLSAIGSFSAVIFSFLFLIPFYFLFSSPLHLYEVFRDYMLYILIGVSALFILTESFSERWRTYQAIPLSLFVFLLSGFLGYVIINMPVHSPFLFHSTMLFPALTGLFGLSIIFFSLIFTPEIPEQRIEEPQIDVTEVSKSVISGSTSGLLVSFLPGITSAHATVMAMLARRNRENEQVIVTLSSVNTADAIFCLATLFVILRARSGATIAISQLLEVPQWETVIPPFSLICLLIVTLISSTFSYFLTKYMGKHFSSLLTKISYREILIFTIITLSLLVFLFTGVLGLLILFVATCIGLLPIYFGVRRSNCMGVLLLPIIISLW